MPPVDCPSAVYTRLINLDTNLQGTLFKGLPNPSVLRPQRLRFCLQVPRFDRECSGRLEALELQDLKGILGCLFLPFGDISYIYIYIYIWSIIWWSISGFPKHHDVHLVRELTFFSAEPCCREGQHAYTQTYKP